jgi:DNA polymerase elongation subunit (family B)
MKILTVDIETSPNLIVDFSCGYNKHIGYKQIVQERKIICVAWKWFGEKEVHSANWGPKQDDKQLLKLLHQAMSQADFVLTQNGDKFDLPWLQTRAMVLKLNPFPPVTSIDLLKLNRKAFNMNSNRLDYVASLLGLGHKSPMELQDWIDITLHNDQNKLDKMIKYNKKDVILTEKVFKRVKSYVKLPAALHHYTNHKETDKCTVCGSGNIQYRGFTYTQLYRRRKYQCNKCYKWSTSRNRVIND